MTYPATVLADTPLVYARLGGADATQILIDSSGNNRTANTLVGTPTYQSASLLTSDTEDKSCTIPAGAGLRWNAAAWMNVNAITLEAWVKPTNIGAGQYPMIMERQPFGSGNFQFRISPTGKLEFIYWAGTGGPFTATGATTLVNGTTYHVVATYDGAARVYLNGVQDGTIAGNGGTLATNNIQLTLAHGFAGDGAQYAPVNFAGVIDEAAMYGTALSPARILAHYQAGVTAPPVFEDTWDGQTDTSGAAPRMISLPPDAVLFSPPLEQTSRIANKVVVSYGAMDEMGVQLEVSAFDAGSVSTYGPEDVRIVTRLADPGDAGLRAQLTLERAAYPQWHLPRVEVAWEALDAGTAAELSGMLPGGFLEVTQLPAPGPFQVFQGCVEGWVDQWSWDDNADAVLRTTTYHLSDMRWSFAVVTWAGITPDELTWDDLDCTWNQMLTADDLTEA